MIMTEKMIKAVTEIAETGTSRIWEVFNICDKHMLNPSEDMRVIAMYEESQQEMRKILEQERIVEEEIKEAMKLLPYHNNMQPISINVNNDTGFSSRNIADVKIPKKQIISKKQIIPPTPNFYFR
ncbi:MULTISPECIES: hypothetical protein [Bacillus cereus group]|uniref:hypothetical protein n=1 Tax=Bacillus cereus group TaxID=86661 RepID=UPI001EE0D165|nr:hypothetical protein [Bacillus thuringiensis]